jgi:hypothetical protein
VRPGYRVNEGDMLISLYRLLCAVLAIAPLYARAKENPADPLVRLQGECFEDEVTHLLVSTAAFNRIYRMQQHPRRVEPDKVTTEPIEGTCGTLRVQSSGHGFEHQPLSFKDACDKILHADAINWDSINKRLTLIGEFKRKPWLAELDIEKNSVDDLNGEMEERGRLIEEAVADLRAKHRYARRLNWPILTRGLSARLLLATGS